MSRQMKKKKGSNKISHAPVMQFHKVLKGKASKGGDYGVVGAREDFDVLDALKSGNNESGEVRLPVDGFFELVKQCAREKDVPPSNYFVSRMVLDGQAEKGQVKLNISFEVSILTDQWTAVTLLSDKVALLTSDITFHGEEQAESAKAENPDESSQMTTRASTKVFQESKDEEGEPSDPTPEEECEADEELKVSGSCVGVVDSHYCLVAVQAGQYVVDVEMLVPYLTSHERGFEIQVPQAAQTELTFLVDKKDLQMKVEPALGLQENPTDNGGGTKVTCRVPSTRDITVQWTEKVEPQKEKDEKEEGVVTSQQHTLLALGEGVVMSTTKMLYEIVRGSVNALDIALDKRVRVLHVEGRALKRWEAVKGSSTSHEDIGTGVIPEVQSTTEPVQEPLELNPLEEEAEENEQILKIWLDYSMEKKYEVTITTELEMGGTSGVVESPWFQCRNVLREKGFVAVEARTNVEVEEVSRANLAMVDVTELPSRMERMASNPLLLAYKFLDPHYQLSLRVTKHDDISVLVASCQEAYFTLITTEEGRELCRIVAKITNTQKQYARFDLPKDANIWSTMVAGVPVKPALDTDGKVMVPLTKGSTDGFKVELVYIVDQDPMTERGSITTTLPKVDIPINKLFVSVFVPENYKYGEFETVLHEVKNFSSYPPQSQGGVPSSHAPLPMPQQPQMQMQMPISQSNVMFGEEQCFDDDFDDEDDMFAPNVPPMPLAGKGGLSRGLIPVSVSLPEKSGEEFKFEQMLFMSGDTELTVPYRRVSKSFFTRRRIGYDAKTLVAVGVAVVGIGWYLVRKWFE